MLLSNSRIPRAFWLTRVLVISFGDQTCQGFRSVLVWRWQPNGYHQFKDASLQALAFCHPTAGGLPLQSLPPLAGTGRGRFVAHWTDKVRHADARRHGGLWL